MAHLCGTASTRLDEMVSMDWSVKLAMHNIVVWRRIDRLSNVVCPFFSNITDLRLNHDEESVPEWYELWE